MRRETLHDLLDALEDTREIVMRRTPPPAEDGLLAAWRDAQAEAVEAYRAWRARPGRDSYAVYLAAEDRADAARVALAAETSAG